MKCENCGKNEVSFVYRSSINGRTEEHHLCQACAEKLGYTSVPNFSRAFTNYFGVPPRRFREIDAQWLDTGRIRLELAKSRAGRKPQVEEEDRSDRKQEQQYER